MRHEVMFVRFPAESANDREPGRVFPLVSVIVPTLNARRFLEPRIESLCALDYPAVEILVVDSGSTDGTRERISEWMRTDGRVRLLDGPRGLYRSLNLAVRSARGDYVYIATADDTCAPDILTKMVALLERHPGCDVCDSRLTEIDAEGRALTEDDAGFLPSFGHLVYPRQIQHVRYAPYDFLLHCSGKTVYTSLTQILVRKSVFAKAGEFPEDWGPSGDYLWGMRVSMACNVVYTPERLATWRVHDSQLTGHDATSRNFELMLQMGRRQIGELPPGLLRQAAEKLHRLVELKTDLLPIKRHGGLRAVVRGLVHAAFCHPWKLTRLALAFFRLRTRRRGGSHAAVYAYDIVFRQQAKGCMRRLSAQGVLTPIGGVP